MSVKYFLSILLLIFIHFVISGCPYTSTIPLSSAEDAVIDDSLPGNWGNPDVEADSSEVLHILPFNNHEYLILFFEKEETTIFRAFSTSIQGENFLSLTEIHTNVPENVNYIFARYRIIRGMLNIRLVEEKLFNEKKFGNSQQLLQFLSTHLDNDTLYGDSQSLVRVNYSKLSR